MTKNEVQSETISFLRFPLIVGVVLIHSQFEEVVFHGVDLMKNGNFPIYTVASYLFSGILPAIAVPLFFFISGFLFFIKTTSFTLRSYGGKLKKRAKTLLLPYLFWNIVVIAFYFLSQTLLPELVSGRQKWVGDYTLSDWIWAFWDTSHINPGITLKGFPACIQFWFLRDLMVVMLFSPIVYFLVNKLGWYAVIGWGLLWFLKIEFPMVGFSTTAFFFFSAGAYFSIHRKNFVELMQPFLFPSAVLFIMLVGIQLGCREESWCGYIYQLNILAGLVFAITLSAYFLEKGKWHVNSFLADSSFFIYAYHAIVLIFVIKLLFRLIQPHTDGMVLAVYIVSPTVVILIGLFFYYILKKYLPKAMGLITGGR